MTIPKGITFGSKVIVIPPIVSGFTHSGYMKRVMKDNYIWVERGEIIGEFNINGNYNDNLFSRVFNSKDHTAPIRCPASGLLLHPTIKNSLPRDWNKINEPPIACFSLLIPDDEPKPESGEFIYKEMCTLVKSMEHYYFRSSRYWSMPGFTSERLEKMINLQLNANPLIFDALPEWADYLDEARIKKPELRPHIKHLSNIL